MSKIKVTVIPVKHSIDAETKIGIERRIIVSEDPYEKANRILEREMGPYHPRVFPPFQGVDTQPALKRKKAKK